MMKLRVVLDIVKSLVWKLWRALSTLQLLLRGSICDSE